jgi:hypothetical protein
MGGRKKVCRPCHLYHPYHRFHEHRGRGARERSHEATEKAKLSAKSFARGELRRPAEGAGIAEPAESWQLDRCMCPPS